MKKLFNYCFYRIAKAYKLFDRRDYCDWGYGVLFATFGFTILSLVTCVLHIFHFKINSTIIVCTFVPFCALDFIFSMLISDKQKVTKYIELDNLYKNEKYRKIKGCLVAIYAIGSFVLYFVTLYACGY